MSPRRTRRARTLDVGDLVFRVTTDVEADERGPAVVLVHGIGMSSRYLARLHDALLPHANVASVDLPGFGGLPKPRRELGIEAMAAALAEVVGSLGLEPVVLVGHSMGSQWVVELARLRPDLVARVVVIGPVADVAHRTPTAQLRALAVDSLLEPPTTNWIVSTDYVRCGVPWYLAQLGPMLSYPIEERVADLAVPLLVIRGERDPIASTRWCRLVRDSAPDARLVHIPRSPHNAQRSAPRAVAAAILAHA
ncbi:alpha/beta hydrolase [Agrococcus citreus]|uniref:Alpha/beta hydrolase n=1 Tax=Agrococcus citreus TaxID=84643 RepID=A0ABN1YNX2_9MICO